MNDLDDLIEQTGALDEVDDSKLKTVRVLAQNQLKLERQIEAAEKDLKDLKRDYRKLSELDLPAAMEEVGLLSFKLADGKEVLVTEKMYASIPKKNMTTAVQWLIEHGQGALIKSAVSVPFAKGDVEEREELLRELTENGYTVQVNDAVSTGSVKAVLKELMQEGTEVPLELFGAHIVRKSEIK